MKPSTMSPRPFEFGRAGGARNVSSEDKIAALLYAFLVEELGWTTENYIGRLKIELGRDIARSVISSLESRGWDFRGKRVLDLGSGLGGLVQELRLQGVEEAFGVEPSSAYYEASTERLREAGFENSIHLSFGEHLPFSDETFDYIISLQVLEHVPAPQLILSEMFRVLKPGGQLYISCENYLSFREMHYRVPWLPLLPKKLGLIYLKALGRNPEFLIRHVTYVTYPSVLRIGRDAGFQDISLLHIDRYIRFPNEIPSALSREVLRAVGAVVPKDALVQLAYCIAHFRNTFRVGTRLVLRKPTHER